MDEKLTITDFVASKIPSHDELSKAIVDEVTKGKDVSFSIGTYNPLEEYMPVSISGNRAMRRQREKKERRAQRRK